MRCLNVSWNALVATALICTIQNAISLRIDSKDNNSRWEILNKSTDKNELKISSMMCLKFINNINEQLKNTKNLSNAKLHEHNQTTNDIVNLTVDIKKNVQKANHDILSVRKLVQNIAIRFRDTFKSIVSLSELECEPANEELESIKKTVVDKSKPSVNSVIRAFGNRHHLSRVANQILKTSSDNEMFKDNYDAKQREAEKEFSTLWNILDNYIQSINRDALITFTTFFQGMKAIKSVKQKINSFNKDKIYDKIEETDITSLKNAVELAKALKLKFEDDWNLDSGELNYSQEQQKTDKSPNDDKRSQINDDIVAVNNDKPDTMEPEIQEIVRDPTNENNDNKNNSPIKKTPLFSPITENKDQTDILQQEIPNEVPNFTDNSSNVDDVHTLVEDTQLTSEKENAEQLTKSSEIPVINKDKQNRKKRQILQWEELIKQANSLIRQGSINCVNTLKATITDLDTINLLAKTSIRAIENHTDLKNTENNIIQQFNNKMIDTNRKLANSLVNGAGDVCTKVTPINTEFVTKFENDQNIKRIQNLLGKKYDPNKYILKVLDEAKKMHRNGSIKKMSYNKMLLVTHNIKNETKEMDDAALYAMNKIHEGTLAESDLSKILNNEKTSKACYIRNMLLEKENEIDKKSKVKNEQKVQEYINENNVSLNSNDKQEDDYEYVDEQDNTVLLDSNVPPKNYVKETTKDNQINISNTNTKQEQPEIMHSDTQRDKADIDSSILRPKEIQTDEKTKTTNLDSDYTNITGIVNDANELENSITENVDRIDNIPEKKNNMNEKVSNSNAREQTNIPETKDTQFSNIQSSQQKLSDPMNNKLDENTDQDSIVMSSPRNDKHDGIVRRRKKGNDYGETTHIIDDNSEKKNSSTENDIHNDNISKKDNNDKINISDIDTKEQPKIPETIDTQIGKTQPTEQELSDPMNNKLDADTDHDNIDISSPRNANHDGIVKSPKKENDYAKIVHVNKDDNQFEHPSFIIDDNEKKIIPINENDSQKKEYNKINSHDPKFDNSSNDIETLKKIPNENIDSIESVEQQIIRNDNNISAVSSYEPYSTSDEEDGYEPTDEQGNTKLIDSDVSPNNHVKKSTTNNPSRNISRTNQKHKQPKKTPDKNPGDQQDMDNITLHLKKVKNHKKDNRPNIEDSIINSNMIDDNNKLENIFTKDGVLNDKISKNDNNDKENVSETENKKQPIISETINTHIGNIQTTQPKLSDPINNKQDRDTDKDNMVMFSPRNDKNDGIVKEPKNGNEYVKTKHIIHNESELKNLFTGHDILNDNIPKGDNNEKENVTENDTKEQTKIPEIIDTQIGNIQTSQQELSDSMNNKPNGDIDHDNIVMSIPRPNKRKRIVRIPKKGNDDISDNTSMNENSMEEESSEADTAEQMKISETMETRINNIPPTQQEISDPINNKLKGDNDHDNIVMSNPRNDMPDVIVRRPKNGNGILNDNISKGDNDEKENIAETNTKEQTKIPEIIDTQIDNIQPSQQELSDPINNKLNGDIDHDNIVMSTPRPNKRKRIVRRPKKGNDDVSDNTSMNENSMEESSEADTAEQMKIPETMETRINNIQPTQQEISDPLNNKLDRDNDHDNIVMSNPRNDMPDVIVRRPKKGNDILNDNIFNGDNNEKKNVAETDTKEQTKIPETIETRIINIQPTEQELSDPINNKLNRDTNDDNILMSILKPNKRKRIVRRPKKVNDYGNDDVSDNTSMNENSMEEESSEADTAEQMKISETMETRINNIPPTQQEISDPINNKLKGDNDHDNIVMSNPRNDMPDVIVRRPKNGNDDVSDNTSMNENSMEEESSEADTAEQMKIPETMETLINNIQPTQQELFDPLNNKLDGDIDHDNIVMSIPKQNKRKRIVRRPKKGNDDVSDNTSMNENSMEEESSEADIAEQMKIPETMEIRINNIQPTQPELSDPLNNKLHGDIDHDNIVMSIPRQNKRKRIVRRPIKGNDDVSDNTSMNENSMEEESSEADTVEQMKIPETMETRINNIQPTQQELSDPLNNKLDGDNDHDNIVMSNSRNDMPDGIVRRPKKGNGIPNDNISNGDNNEKENVAETKTKEQTKIPDIIDTQIGNIQPTEQELSDPMNIKLDRDTNDDNIVMSIPKPNKRKRIVRRPKKVNDYENGIFNDNISNGDNNEKENVAETYTKEQTKIPEIIDTQIGNIQPSQQELLDPMNNKLDRDTNDDNIVMSIPKPNKRKRIVRRPKKGNGDFFDNMPKNENNVGEKSSVANTSEQMKIPETMETQISDTQSTQKELFSPMDNVLANVDESNKKIESEPTGTSLLSKNLTDLMDDNKIIDNDNTYPLQDTENLNVGDDVDDEELEENLTSLNDQGVKKKPKHRRRRRKITTINTNKKTTTTEENPLHYAFNYNIDNVDEYNVPESTVELSKDHSPRPKRTRRVRRIKQYSVDEKGDERIPYEESESNKSISDDIRTDDGDFSSFLFKKNNADQCKRYAYDSFRTVTIHDAKTIAFESIVNTSELNSHVLATIGNAINDVKASMTLNDVDQSMRTVSYTLKTGLKQTINEMLTKVIPLTEYIMETAENIKAFYQNGPQSTYKMLTNVLESEPKISDMAKSALSIISPGFNVDEMINNIFDMPYDSDTSLKQRRANAQRKLIDLSIHMDTVMSNMDCFILFTMATIGNGASTLKSLKSRKVIMTDEHPRVKALRDTIGIIVKLSEYIRNGKIVKTVNASGVKENGVSKSDRNPDRTFQKRENVLTPKPNLNNSRTTSRSVTINRERTLGVIVVYPNRQIVYEKMANRPELDEFIEEETRKYTRKFRARDHPVFLKVSSRKEIAPLIEKVKKKDGYDGMSNVEIRNEITKMLNNNRVVL